jgi:hypothetical protein
MKNLKELEGKNIKVYLVTGKIYTGKVLEVEERVFNKQSGASICFITLLDQFQKRVGFVSSEIKSYEQKDG